jgi:hypothetical protein
MAMAHTHASVAEQTCRDHRGAPSASAPPRGKWPCAPVAGACMPRASLTGATIRATSSTPKSCRTHCWPWRATMVATARHRPLPACSPGVERARPSHLDTCACERRRARPEYRGPRLCAGCRRHREPPRRAPEHDAERARQRDRVRMRGAARAEVASFAELDHLSRWWSPAI